MDAHPVRLAVEDDLHRNRLTVFFRLLLYIPHFIWIELWSIAVFVVAIIQWAITLVTGRPAAGLHRFLSAYVRYATHLSAYIHLVGNPYPGFTGEEGEYPVDISLPAPAPQRRLVTLFRIFLVLPALMVNGALGGSPPFFARVSRSGGRSWFISTGLSGLAGTTAVLGWFASVARGGMPQGLRDAGAYSVGYNAQALAYLLFVTDRYPSSDPVPLLAGVKRPPEHPVRLVGDADDLRRSRLTVFFRLPLAIPHLVWLTLWSIAAAVAVFLNWWVLLFRGTPAGAFHRFNSRFVRYSLHVYAFLFLAANPFPGFTGETGRYPLDLVLPEPARQNRWVTFFRVLLAIPAWFVQIALFGALFTSAVLTWFYALVRGSAPEGLRNLSAYALRYGSQVNAYYYLLTDVYPHSSPLEGGAEEEPEPEPTAEPQYAW